MAVKSVDWQAPWTTCFAPKTKEDLCVNTKKLAELEAWFRANFDNPGDRRHRVLLLTGPAGSGKSSAVNVLANVFKVKIENFREVYLKLSDDKWYIDNDLEEDAMANFNEPHYKQFEKFLFNPNMCAFGRPRKLGVVDDINFFATAINHYREIVRRFSKSPCRNLVPLIFIVTEQSRVSVDICKQFFHDDFVRDCGIQQLNFNALTKTSISKALSKIGHGFVSKEDLNEIAEESHGDIRCGINAFEFKFRHLLEKLVTSNRLPLTGKRPKKRVCKMVDSNVPVAARQPQLSFYHILGKVLYCKRNDNIPSSEELLPEHLHHFRRRETKERAENLVDCMPASTEKTNQYLHEHYIHFLNSIEDVAMASPYLSFSDALCSKKEWELKAPWDRLQNLINVRGLMFTITGENRVNTLYKFTHPVSTDFPGKERNLRSELRNNPRFVGLTDENILDYVSFISAIEQRDRSMNFETMYSAVISNYQAVKRSKFHSGLRITNEPDDIKSMYCESDEECIIEDC